jgi:hypothetical protein
MKVNFSIFWSAQSPDLNIIELLLSVLETRVIDRIPLSSFLKQRENVLQEELYTVLLETVARLHSKKDCGCTEGKSVVQHHSN